MARAAPRPEDFEFVKNIHNPDADANQTATGAFNAGIDLVRRKRDGLLVVRKYIADQDFREGYHFQEAHFLRLFKNPHINRFVHIGRERVQRPNGETHEGEALYIRYCDGGTLYDLQNAYSERDLAVPEAFIWHVFRSMADALCALHYYRNRTDTREPADMDANYIVHGDIKPPNIFLQRHQRGKFPTVVLGDFGAAMNRYQMRHLDAAGVQRTPTRMTPCYSAPESLQHFGLYSDVFAVGLLVFYLTGCAFQPAGVTTQAQVDLLDGQTGYSSHLRDAAKLALTLDWQSRLRATHLVEQLDAAFAAAVRAGLVSVDARLPAWALPRTGSRQPPRFSLSTEPIDDRQYIEPRPPPAEPTSRRSTRRRRDSARASPSRMQSIPEQTVPEINSQPPTVPRTERPVLPPAPVATHSETATAPPPYVSLRANDPSHRSSGGTVSYDGADDGDAGALPSLRTGRRERPAQARAQQRPDVTPEQTRRPAAGALGRQSARAVEVAVVRAWPTLKAGAIWVPRLYV